MTLKEKFNNIIYNYVGSEWDRRDVSNNLEKEAEEFAIGFTEWLMKIRFKSIECLSVESLLEIYKKEKRL
jgi:hypothetical protein